MGKKIVITHIKADFDAIASAWAAYHLYGCDQIWICTEMESNVKSYINKLNNNPILYVKPKDIDDIIDVEHLIITDCKQIKRIGDLARLLPKAKRITIFDHHPVYAKDIDANDAFIYECGSTVTILIKRLIDAGIKILPYEASLYMLGIYEDTGLLTFSNTTKDDILTIAMLLDYGADISIISDYVGHELNRGQVFILNELLMNMAFINVDGINVAYSTASLEVYAEELAFITQRMMDVEGLDTLFILVRGGSRISLVGRSKNRRVDAGQIAVRFGGGGHSAAASATIKDLELYEATELLKITLREQIKPVRTVSEIMSTPARSLDISTNIENATNYIRKYNLNHVPVTDNEKTVGVLSRKDLWQGIKHNLQHQSISIIMQAEIDTVTPDTPFEDAEHILLSSNQKILPVQNDGILMGVITRTDLLRLMHEEQAQRTEYEEHTKDRLGLSGTRSIKDQMQRRLSPKYYSYIKEIGELANNIGKNTYLVGGFVRDLIMGHPNLDMDIVVEGDAIILASEFARTKGGKLTLHVKYKTASVTLANSDKIDFASARAEYYSNPGAAPAVEFSSLKKDLTRRDFTINAMAIRIDGDEFGQLIDYFGGQRDIIDHKIRVLHSLSFIDDPTRAFRAIRFLARYEFKLGSNSERLMKHAESAGVMSKVPSNKFFIEIKYILMEDMYMTAIAQLIKYNLLKFIAHGIAVNDDRIKQFLYLDELHKRFICDDVWQTRFVLLMYNHTTSEYREILDNLHVTEALHTVLSNLHGRSKHYAKKIKSLKLYKPSEIYVLLKKRSHDEILMTCVALGEQYSEPVIAFLEQYRHVKTELTGSDLKQMGIPSSKIMGEILNELLYAKIDGIVNTKAQEEKYVRNRIKQI